MLGGPRGQQGPLGKSDYAVGRGVRTENAAASPTRAGFALLRKAILRLPVQNRLPACPIPRQSEDTFDIDRRRPR
jgi:hypothetical protein